ASGEVKVESKRYRGAVLKSGVVETVASEKELVVVMGKRSGIGKV
ncbi:hypothetical protein Leryth_026337, partial [Lithospermum erythrorhizon]